MSFSYRLSRRVFHDFCFAVCFHGSAVGAGNHNTEYVKLSDHVCMLCCALNGGFVRFFCKVFRRFVSGYVTCAHMFVRRVKFRNLECRLPPASRVCALVMLTDILLTSNGPFPGNNGDQQPSCHRGRMLESAAAATAANAGCSAADLSKRHQRITIRKEDKKRKKHTHNIQREIDTRSARSLHSCKEGLKRSLLLR